MEAASCRLSSPLSRSALWSEHWTLTTAHLDGRQRQGLSRWAVRTAKVTLIPPGTGSPKTLPPKLAPLSEKIRCISSSSAFSEKGVPIWVRKPARNFFFSAALHPLPVDFKTHDNRRRVELAGGCLHRIGKFDEIGLSIDEGQDLPLVELVRCALGFVRPFQSFPGGRIAQCEDIRLSFRTRRNRNRLRAEDSIRTAIFDIVQWGLCLSCKHIGFIQDKV